MADATPEPRAELVQRARELARYRHKFDCELDCNECTEDHAQHIAAALADVEREAEAALARKVRAANVNEFGGVGDLAVERVVALVLDPKEPTDAT